MVCAERSKFCRFITMSRHRAVTQAVVVADLFSDALLPISNDIPLYLLPVGNKPLIEYTFEFLTVGGIKEVFLFCSTHADKIKRYIDQSNSLWCQSMKITVIVSESCRSFGDCLRDLDHRGFLRGSFVLLEPGVISNVALAPIIKRHNEIVAKDRGAVMTVIYQVGGKVRRSERNAIALDKNNKILFHQEVERMHKRQSYVSAELQELACNNDIVKMSSNLKDTHVAICTPSVLPLFTDNFDFQTKTDFIRGLLMNEEIMGSTIYGHVVTGTQYGAAVTDWRSYLTISRELQQSWARPIHISILKNKIEEDSLISRSSIIGPHVTLTKSVIGDNVEIGANVDIEGSVIFADTKIGDNVTIRNSIVGQNCRLKPKCKVTAGSIISNNVIVDSDLFIENTLVQSQKPDDCEEEDTLGTNAYRLRLRDEDGEILPQRPSLLHLSDTDASEEERSELGDSDDDRSSTHSPPPDDTKLFFIEVVESLTRGFEDQLQCDNLILEINSSRYAYNVALKEVNFNVVRAILHMSLKFTTGPRYFSQCARLLSYFAPILKNYIRNESAMNDMLQAVEDIAESDDVNDKWVMFVLKWFYDNEYVPEEVVLSWYKTLDNESKFYSQVKPFTDWLEEAEEATTSSDDD